MYCNMYITSLHQYIEKNILMGDFVTVNVTFKMKILIQKHSVMLETESNR